MLTGKVQQELTSVAQKIMQSLGDQRIKIGSVEPGETLFSLLSRKKMRCAFAESCTGGLLSALITDLPGSSEIYWGSVTVYSNQAKKSMLGIPDEILDRYGAVSEETVSAMARGIIEVSGSELGISISGVAGPGGGTAEKPVGTVWIGAALASGGELIRRFHFTGNRRRIRDRSAVAAFLLAEELLLS
jgi:PncC family amidohydrolase